MKSLSYNSLLRRRQSNNGKEKTYKSNITADLISNKLLTLFLKSKSTESLSHQAPYDHQQHRQQRRLGGDTVVEDHSSGEEIGGNSRGTSHPEDLTLDHSALLAPCEYIRLLPSKDIRAKLIDAFNIRFQVPESNTTIIKEVINDLHNASLILDDIQDDSLLRRGSPATHCIFGNAQSINSATYMFMNTALTLHKHLPTPNSDAMNALLNGMMELFVGQSWELKWKFHTHCPTMPEYMAMIDGKTGAMFKLLITLMHSLSPHQKNISLAEFDQFATLLGRFYQVRDDYINLQDDDYSELKGFCEDLDEGKFSHPVVWCCNADQTARDTILGLFRQKAVTGMELSRNTKIHILTLIKCSGGFDATWDLLQNLRGKMGESLASLEEAMGIPNPALRHMMTFLGNMQPPK